MAPSPIALFVYNRPEHTAATLAALRANDLAARSELRVFCDGPARERDRAAVEAVRRIVRSAGGFASIELFERERNAGLAASIIEGVSSAIAAAGRLIVLEDDLVTSPHFLRFMNAALDRYADVPEVFSVSGYNLPLAVMRPPRGYPYDAYFNPRSSSWGWATWRDRWERADWDVAGYEAFARDPAARRAFNAGGDDLADMLDAQRAGRIDSWSIRWSFTHFAHRAVAVYPVKSYVDNIGLDGSGTHCSADPLLRDDPSRAVPEVRFPDEVRVDAAMMRAFRAHYSRGRLADARRAIQRAAARRDEPRAERVLRALLVNRRDVAGGAARAAHRLLGGIAALGADARMLVSEKASVDARVVRRGSRLGRLQARLHPAIDRLPVRLARGRPISPWSTALFPTGIAAEIRALAPDVVHLHWVGSGQVSIGDLPAFGRPIVWTLHDMWAFTGGCHYDGGCGRWEGSCGACPVLGSKRDADLSRLLWAWKRRRWAGLHLTAVAPSRWLAECARRSSLFRDVRVEVIPNGLDLEIHKPVDRAAARHALGLPQDKRLIVFGAMSATSDARKGFQHLAPALSRAAGALSGTAELVVLGAEAPSRPPELGLPAHYLGELADDRAINLVYASADVVVVPSVQDNLPNTAMEALAAGAPVVAFDVGGNPDMIEHEVNGFLAPPFDAGELARGLVRTLEDPTRWRAMSAAARAKIEREFEISAIARRYLSLYEEVAGRARPGAER